MQKLSEAEYELATIIWQKQPIGSGELAQICEKQMGWKRSTTYTLLKRMIEKEAAENTNTMVTMKLSKEEVDRESAEDLIQKSYQGSLPMFIAAYTKGRKLSEEEAAELKKLIRRSEGK